MVDLMCFYMLLMCAKLLRTVFKFRSVLGVSGR